MEDRSKDDPDIAADLEYLRAETELREHEDDPLDTELRVFIQPFTLERLRRYQQRQGEDDLGSLVNEILASFLYSQGE